jgi:hypothetical protein
MSKLGYRYEYRKRQPEEPISTVNLSLEYYLDSSKLDSSELKCKNRLDEISNPDAIIPFQPSEYDLFRKVAIRHTRAESPIIRAINILPSDHLTLSVQGLENFERVFNNELRLISQNPSAQIVYEKLK